MELLDHDNIPIRYILSAQAQPLGIEAFIAMNKGELLYELKLPLFSSDTIPYAINCDTCSIVDIYLEVNSNYTVFL